MYHIPPTAKRPFALLVDKETHAIRVETVRVVEVFDVLQAAYVVTINGGVPYYLAFNRLASTLEKTREKIRALRKTLPPLSVSAPQNAVAVSTETPATADAAGVQSFA